ncbi:histidine phosphatase family protein [Hymenobacter cheonanensis]|uniref:histidine phosphatase family protein n=1 Tax=Hymenobacter sp. CA2-7 TaxID=3063993 RepID=UPI00271260E7|nr:histidine phosphatase family protein [Hymenobacter sp. CA2-7]MDO7887616.1 histidine phosphatase family protein [Hymenobacter sp. CA2-7]
MPDFTALDKARLYLLYRLSPLAPPVRRPRVLRVVIIRHGEKPADGDNLSCAGLNRALALPAVLDRLLPTPPNYAYVPIIGTNDDSTSQARMFQTITPYAVRHNLCVNSDYAVDNAKGLAQELRRQRGTALVVWEHNAISEIAKQLGLDEELEWPDEDFDSIWTIDFSGGGARGKAKRPTLTRHRQGIHPAATCPG